MVTIRTQQATTHIRIVAVAARFSALRQILVGHTEVAPMGALILTEGFGTQDAR